MNKILFLGPEGSYSHKVAKELNKELEDYVMEPQQNFQSIHNGVLENKTFIGVLPFENSITTNIYENVEFMFDNDILYIIGEYFLPIKLNLIGHKNSNINNIKNVYSHPKALKQCSNFITKHNVNTIQSLSTSNAQYEIQKLDNSNFAISSEVILDELEIKQGNIGNYSNNKTRFIFVSQNKIQLPHNNNKKISFIFKLKHQKGTLYSLLGEILNNSINMTKIESKPIPDSDFEYLFMVEGIGDDVINEKQIKNILNKLTLENRIVGIY